MAPVPMAADDVVQPPSPVAVHFGHARSDISASTMQMLWEVAPALKAANPVVIHVTGYTDGSGKRAFNQALSARRAQAVADQLRKLGVSAEIKVSGQGVIQGAKKGRKDASLRRVEITWETAKPAKSATSQPVESPERLSSGGQLPHFGLAMMALDRIEPASIELSGIAQPVPAAEPASLATTVAVVFEATGPPAGLS